MKIAVLVLFTSAACWAASCGSMASFTLPNTTITSAQIVPAGAFAPPPQASANPPDPAFFKNLPGFCRIAATLKPSGDSDIKIEVWMPAAGWNGKLQSVGNGGWAGTIGYMALGPAVAAGYAAAGTDTGHTGNNADFALGHPEKVTDFAYRSVH